MIKIGNRLIGPGQPCFIIAEAGVNHNGDYRLACRLIEVARDSGADAVKFQTWITDKLVLKDAALAEYQRKNLKKAKSQYQMLKELELSYTDFRRLQAYAKKCGIHFLSTPDEEESADFLEKLGISIFKIGSGEVNNLPYLEHIARKMKPVILSTGMSTLGDVEAAVRTVENAGNTNLVILQCVSSYPAKAGDCNLAAMQTLRAAFGYPVGFSDHTVGNTVAVAAVALGACVLEKHLTLDHRMDGPDHRASASPEDFSALVRAVRETEAAMGNGIKRPTLAELETKKVVQKSLVASRVIRSGAIIARADLVLRRTTGGVPISALPFVEGRRAKYDIPALTCIALDSLE